MKLLYFLFFLVLKQISSDLYQHIVATQEALQYGLEVVEEEHLTYALQLAEQIGYNLEDYASVPLHFP